MATAVEILTTLLTLAGLVYLVLALWGTRDFGRHFRTLRAQTSPTPAAQPTLAPADTTAEPLSPAYPSPASPPPEDNPSAPAVSILKPVKGVDPRMYPGLASHCRQQYPGPFEILFGVSSLDDPAVPEIHRLQAEFPHIPIRIIHCTQRLGASGKVTNLVQMLPHARHPYILINDSDIRVSPLYLTRIMHCFSHPTPTPTPTRTLTPTPTATPPPASNPPDVLSFRPESRSDAVEKPASAPAPPSGIAAALNTLSFRPERSAVEKPASAPAPPSGTAAALNTLSFRPERSEVEKPASAPAPPQGPPEIPTPVGLVTAPYLGRTPARGHGLTLWASLEALGISTDFLPGVLAARKLEGGIRFGLGSTLALSRPALDAIGGLLPLVNSLADDYELGARIARAGFRVELAPEIVETSIPAYTFRPFWDHQLRWARSTRDSRRWGYLGLGITYAVPWAILNCIATGFELWSFSLLSLVLLARTAVALAVGVGILNDPQVLRDLWLLPLRDCTGLLIWAWSFASDTIVWRGEHFRLHRGHLTPLP